MGVLAIISFRLDGRFVSTTALMFWNFFVLTLRHVRGLSAMLLAILAVSDSSLKSSGGVGGWKLN